MLGRVSKRQPIRLKFDTSLGNLACFINSNSKVNGVNNDKEQQISSTQKRMKSTQQNSFTFKNEDFLQSILVNTFTQEFACAEDIKKLVSNTQICSEQDLSPQPKLNSLITSFNSKTDQQLNRKSSTEDNYKSLMSNWVQTPKNHRQAVSTFGTEQTPEKSKNIPNYPIQSQYADKNLTPYYQYFQRCEYTAYYDQNYYVSQLQYPTNGQIQRKKRFVQSQEPKQYRIDPNNIQQDGRTTLMIRNIPNKYTQELLLQEFNKTFKFKFDFFYLPIDYNNSCNVGYAFINFIHAKFILAFYEEFNGKRWARFNSEKICSLTYARIQGTGALRNHFKNSQVMQQKDKRLKPLLNELDQQKRQNLSKIVHDQQVKNAQEKN